MRESLEQLLRAADVPSPERAEVLWAEYRTGGPGAEAAFNTLLAWYGLVIYRRIWGFVRSDAAEDVFQDVLAKLHRRRQKLATFEHHILADGLAMAVEQEDGLAPQLQRPVALGFVNHPPPPGVSGGW